MRALVWSACVLGLGLCGHVSVVEGANKPMHRTLQQQATGGVVRQGEQHAHVRVRRGRGGGWAQRGPALARRAAYRT
jgi:hypothetical protein